VRFWLRIFLCILSTASTALFGWGQLALPAVAAGGQPDIVYVGSGYIYALNPDGSSSLVYANDSPYAITHPTYSPDGSRLAFSTNLDPATQANPGIYIAGRNGENPSRLTPDDTGYKVQPSWSPDGKEIAYTCNDGSGYGICAINMSTLQNRVLSAGAPGMYQTDPSWLPDSSGIVFTSANAGTVGYQLYIMDRDGGNKQRLTDGSQSSWLPAVSPDGSKIAYVVGPRDIGQTSVGDLYVMDRDGSNSRLIDRGTEPTWLNDSALVYTGPNGLQQYNFNDSTYVPLTSGNDSQATIRPVLTAPPVEPEPLISSVAVDPAVASDALLTRGITLATIDNGAVVNHFEYGWSQTAATPPPGGKLQQSQAPHGELTYNDTRPNQDWYLFARGVNVSGVAGLWFGPITVHTPKAPVLIAIGDSITSGHHNDPSNGDVGTTCEDPSYGYAGKFAAKWAAALPVGPWRNQSRYINVADSGFATQLRNNSTAEGSVLDGGTDACQNVVDYVPVTEAHQLLKARAGSWNQVIATGGINDMNWSAVVTDIVQRQAAKYAAGGGSIAASVCQNIINNKWNGLKSAVLNSITNGVGKITTRLRTADSGVRITWLGYYNIAGTGTNTGFRSPYVPDTCQAPVENAVGAVNSAAQAGLPLNATFISTEGVMNSDDTKLQPLYAIGAGINDLFRMPNPPGWPHPNEAGAAAIAGLLQP
jgi:hypothetical protein